MFSNYFFRCVDAQVQILSSNQIIVADVENLYLHLSSIGLDHYLVLMETGTLNDLAGNEHSGFKNKTGVVLKAPSVGLAIREYLITITY